MAVEQLVLTGRHVRLEPLGLNHLDGIVAAATADPSLYTWSPIPQGGLEATRYINTAIEWREAGTAVKSSHHQSPDICDIAVSQKSTSMRVPRLLYRLQNSMNRRICYRRMRSMGELFSGFEV